jgi:predicted permease
MASSSLFDGFYASMLSTFHLLYIVILGILAKKLKMVDDNFQRSLSKVVTNIILPCFIFALIVNNFRISQYQIILEAMLGCCF